MVYVSIAFVASTTTSWGWTRSELEAEKTKNDIRIIKKVKIYCLYDSVADSLFLPYVLKVSESQNEIFCLQISQKANQILERFLPYDARAEIC